MIAPNYIDHSNQLGGLESIKRFYNIILKGFPDFHRSIDDIIAEGDKVWVLSTYSGTHKGEYKGVAPTGKKITFQSVNIYRMGEGRIVETWSVTDSLDLLKQLGIIEYTEMGKKLIPEE